MRKSSAAADAARRAARLLIAVLLLAAAPGCSLGGQPEIDPALSALSTSVSATATDAALEDVADNPLATVQTKATAQSVERQATQTVQSQNRGAEQLAQATVAAPIVAELPQFGLDPAAGRVGWVHDPLTLDISGYQQFAYGNDHMEVTAADFALAADVTWETQYGSSGCGYMFRSDGNKSKPNQYMLLATRFGNGHVIFTALADGEIANVHDFYPRTEDRSFSVENGATNRLAIVARGTLIEIYTNGVKIGEVDTTQPPAALPAPPKPQPPADLTNQPLVDAYNSQLAEYMDIIERSQSSFQTAMKNYMNRPAVFTDGFLAMVAASESGRTVCTYSDAWLWLIEEP